MTEQDYLLPAPPNEIIDGVWMTRARYDELMGQRADLLAACEAFVTAWEKSLQLEKTDVALRMARNAIAKARGEE